MYKFVPLYNKMKTNVWRYLDCIPMSNARGFLWSGNYEDRLKKMCIDPQEKIRERKVRPNYTLRVSKRGREKGGRKEREKEERRLPVGGLHPFYFRIFRGDLSCATSAFQGILNVSTFTFCLVSHDSAPFTFNSGAVYFFKRVSRMQLLVGASRRWDFSLIESTGQSRAMLPNRRTKEDYFTSGNS